MQKTLSLTIVFAILAWTVSLNLAHAANFVCPGFTLGFGSHYISITTPSGKSRAYPIVSDSDDGETAMTPSGPLIVKDATVTIGSKTFECRQ